MMTVLALLSSLGWFGSSHLSAQFDSHRQTQRAIAQAEAYQPRTNASTCPADLKALTALLVQDLPSYANRVIQRAAILPESAEIDTYIIVAGQPEFEPLGLGPGQYSDSTTDPEPPEQVFFTTLERQYLDNRVFITQNYHWLFLTQTDDGWRMALLYTRLGSPSNTPPRPPLETSDSIIGQAVRLWLRDCQAGTLRKAEASIRMDR